MIQEKKKQLDQNFFSYMDGWLDRYGTIETLCDAIPAEMNVIKRVKESNQKKSISNI